MEISRKRRCPTCRAGIEEIRTGIEKHPRFIKRYHCASCHRSFRGIRIGRRHRCLRISWKKQSFSMTFLGNVCIKCNPDYLEELHAA